MIAMRLTTFLKIALFEYLFISSYIFAFKSSKMVVNII